jgi:hypothetical protein
MVLEKKDSLWFLQFPSGLHCLSTKTDISRFSDHLLSHHGTPFRICVDCVGCRARSETHCRSAAPNVTGDVLQSAETADVSFARAVFTHRVYSFSAP